MLFVPLHLETERKFPKRIFRVPVIGGFLYLFLSMFPPVMLMFFTNKVFGLDEETMKGTVPFAYAIMDLWLRSKGVKFSIVFLPAWVIMTTTGFFAWFGWVK